MKILGIDPGGTTGVGIIQMGEDKRLLPTYIGQLTKKDDKTKRLRDLILSVEVIVVENFLVRPGKAAQGAFDWNSMDTSKEIGKIQTLCELEGKKCVLQEPSVKPVGYGWANMKYVPGKKGTHDKDALAHAVFYAVKNLGALPVGPS